MKRLLIFLVVSWTCACAATTYYVSSSAGSDINDGLSPATAWSTLASVSAGGSHAALIVPGTTVLLARGDVWREPLAPGSSGVNGSAIVFDAYGSGAAPEITGALPLSGWTQAAGYTNQWKAAVPGSVSAVNWVLFGTVWGTRQGSQSAVQHDRDFYFSGGFLYVFPL